MPFSSFRGLFGTKAGTTASTIVEPTRLSFPFLRLPAEVRSIVYDMVMLNATKHVYTYHVKAQDSTFEQRTLVSTLVPRVLIQISRKIRAETIVLYCHTNTFHVSACHWGTWLNVVRPYAKHIRNLRIGIACPCYCPWTRGGTLDLLPLAKFYLEFPLCRIGLLPSCAHRIGIECRPAVPSLALYELRFGYPPRITGRDLQWKQILFPAEQGQCAGPFWEYERVPEDLQKWESIIHRTVQTYDWLLYMMCRRDGPWPDLIQNGILCTASFQLNRERFYIEVAPGYHGTIRGRILQDELDPSRRPKWKSLKGPQVMKLSTRDLVDEDEEADWNHCLVGRAFTWRFYYHSKPSIVVRTMRHLGFDLATPGSWGRKLNRVFDAS